MEALEIAFPLTAQHVVSIASVLHAAGLKAGDQYLAEAKAMHVGTGYEWSDTLESHASMCKRALRRDKGPDCRAKEVKIQELSEDTWELVTLAARNPQRVVCVGHVVIDNLGKKVTLHIPKSKTDQEASGTAGRWAAATSQSGPVALAIRALADRPNAMADEPLFPDCEGNHVAHGSWLA